MNRASRRLWPFVLAAVLAGTACSEGPPGPEAPLPGTALDEGPDVLIDARVPPGQELIRVVPALRNVSAEPIEITKLRAIPGGGVPDVAQIVDVSVVPSNWGLSGRRFVTYPPVVKRDGRCLRAPVRAGRGVTLEPHDGRAVLVWTRALTEGRASVMGFRVTYEEGDTLYEQEIELDLENALVVAEDAPAIKPNADEAACAHRTRVLPGAVTY